MLPKPIYELLPYLYGVFGLMAFFNVEVMSGRVCGVLLALAGAIIWRMRWIYRKEWTEMKARCYSTEDRW